MSGSSPRADISDGPIGTPSTPTAAQDRRRADHHPTSASTTGGPEDRQPSSLADGPIFIGGADRSGKTMLRAFLTSHSRLSIPAVGSNMWTYFYGHFGDLAIDENLDRCLAAMLRYKHVRFLQPDRAAILAEFHSGPPTYGRLFATFQRQHAEREGKPRWGDQSGLIERYAEEIFAAYPGTVMLHLVRDPRDRWAAVRERWGDGQGGVGGAVAKWRYSARLAERNAARYDERYLVIRFEDLVLDVEATLRAVCQRIGERYEPTMATMAGAPEYRAKVAAAAGSRARTSGPGSQVSLDPSFVGWYHGRISARDERFIVSTAGAEMASLGYRSDVPTLPASDRLRYGVLTWPLNRLRAGAWAATEGLQQRNPSRFGRQPSRDKIAAS